MLKNILLTGEPGVGKSTVIMAILGSLPYQAAGFFTQEILAGKTRKGFTLHTLQTQQQAILAHQNKKSTYKVGKFGIDVKVIDELAVPELQNGIAHKLPLLVIDEIGRMECYSKLFRDTVQRCLDGPTPVLGTLQNFCNPLVESILNREDVVLINITEQNRDTLAEKVVQLLNKLVKLSPTRKRR